MNRYLRPAAGSPPDEWPDYGISFVEAIKRALRKYAVFEGRASRGEFWWWSLFVIVALTVLTLVTSIIERLLALIFGMGGLTSAVSWLLNAVLVIVWLVCILPSVSVTVRRLHDSGHSGWLYLLTFVPVVNFVLLVLTLQPASTRGVQYDRAGVRGETARPPASPLSPNTPLAAGPQPTLAAAPTYGLEASGRPPGRPGPRNDSRRRALIAGLAGLAAVVLVSAGVLVIRHATQSPLTSAQLVEAFTPTADKTVDGSLVLKSAAVDPTQFMYNRGCAAEASTLTSNVEGPVVETEAGHGFTVDPSTGLAVGDPYAEIYAGRYQSSEQAVNAFNGAASLRSCEAQSAQVTTGKNWVAFVSSGGFSNLLFVHRNVVVHVFWSPGFPSTTPDRTVSDVNHLLDQAG